MTQTGRVAETDAASADAVGFVLAGGRSSRMGSDKSLAPLAGRPLLSYALATLRQAGLAASIAGSRSPLGAFAPVVEDSGEGRGPLGGICAALASMSGQRAVFVPVDLPLLPASLLAFLLHHARITGGAVTLASVNGFAQTFPAVIERAVLPQLESELDAGRGGCFAAFQSAATQMGRRVDVVPVEMLVQCGQIAHPDGLPAVRWFLNVNAPEDLRQAQAHLNTVDQVI